MNKATLGGFGDGGDVEIGNLGLVEGDLWVLGVVMNLHRFDVGGCDLAVRALVLGVSALFNARPVGQPRLASAPIGGCGVDLRGDFLRRVLLRLGLSSHRDLLEALLSMDFKNWIEVKNPKKGRSRI
ncbi:hypothetical protein F0562_025633 [Nyssa sinensis]|uniref:Uncharacterized protein n=1 Tax=Nyssa sinensis TaxID=561372 RepID=A0A5J5BCK4_9ASTE|nr:hypothetical protein F0562_025633 [Nyssa sinensis]